MRLTSAIQCLLAIAISSSTALPLTERDGLSAGYFSIANFRDSGSPHSVQAYIYFTVSDASATTPIDGVVCSATQAIQPSVATAYFGTACQDPSVVFGLQSALNGYYLTVAHAYDNNKTTDAGTIFLGRDVQVAVNPNNPNGNYDYLNHPATFDFSYNRVVT